MSFADRDHAKGSSPLRVVWSVDEVTDQLSIARFKNMQWQYLAGNEHGSEGKQCDYIGVCAGHGLTVEGNGA